jgi:hypothetical protein
MWIFLRIATPKLAKGAKALDWAKTTKMHMENKRAILIFELGTLQVFHYQTPEEVEFNQPYKDIYWQDRVTKQTYGPFPNIYEATRHHAYIKMVEKGDKQTAKVIRIDFKTKKRLESKDI